MAQIVHNHAPDKQEWTLQTPEDAFKGLKTLEDVWKT